MQFLNSAHLAPCIGVRKRSFSTMLMMQCSLAIPKPLSCMSWGGCVLGRPILFISLKGGRERRKEGREGEKYASKRLLP